MDFLLNHAYSFYFGLGAFLCFLVLLAKFGIKPITQALDARDAKIASDLKESEDAYLKAKSLKEQLDTQLRNAESKIAEMMAEARRDAEAHKARTVEQGRNDIEAIRNRVMREIDGARQAALIELREAMAEISTGVAEKILRQNLDAGRHEQLVVQAMEGYEKSGPAKVGAAR